MFTRPIFYPSAAMFRPSGRAAGPQPKRAVSSRPAPDPPFTAQPYRLMRGRAALFLDVETTGLKATMTVIELAWCRSATASRAA